jgi:hypothetical protein
LIFNWTEESSHIPLAWKPAAFVFGITQILGYELEFTHNSNNEIEIKEVLSKLAQSEYPQTNPKQRRAILNYLLFNLETQVFPGKRIKTLDVIDTMYGNT